MAPCIVTGTVVNQGGTPVTAIPVNYKPIGNPVGGNVQLGDELTVWSTGTSPGNLTLPFEQGQKYAIWSGTGPSVTYTAPLTSTAILNISIVSIGVSNSTPAGPGQMAIVQPAPASGNIATFGEGGQVQDGKISTTTINGVTFFRHGPGIALYSSGGIQTIPGDGTSTQINLGHVLYDDLGIFDESFPNQFIIPVGVSRMSLLAKVNISEPPVIGDNSSSLFAQILRSPSSPIVFVQPIPHLGGSSYLTNDPNWIGSQVCSVEITTKPIPVTPGDIWTVWAQQGTGANQNCSSARFEAEFF